MEGVAGVSAQRVREGTGVETLIWPHAGGTNRWRRRGEMEDGKIRNTGMGTGRNYKKGAKMGQGTAIR